MIDRQHTIPQFYLRYFCPCWVYQLGKSKPRQIVTPTHESVHSKYYGKLDEINTTIEDKGAPIYKKLVESMHFVETSEDQFMLALLFANLFLRNPTNVERWRSVRTLVATAIIEKIKILQQLHGTASELLAQLNSEYKKLEAQSGYRYAVADNFGVLLDVAECINQMSFYVFEAPIGSYFLTSDSPMILTGAWANHDTLGQITLRPTRLLVMSNVKLTSIKYLNQATPEQVDKTNIDIIGDARRNIYSVTPNEHAHEWMTKNA